MAAKAKKSFFISNDSQAAYAWRRADLSAWAFRAYARRGAALIPLAGFARDSCITYAGRGGGPYRNHSPRVMGRDRKALLARKRQQQWRQPLQQCLAAGRERMDGVMIVCCSPACSNDELDGWLNCLQRRKVPLAAVCSMALLCVSVVKRFNPDAEHVLLEPKRQEVALDRVTTRTAN